MNTRAKSRRAWRKVSESLSGQGGATATIPKTAIPHPRDAGALPTATWPVGQIADYSLITRKGEPPLAVREFDDRFEAMVEGVRMTMKAVDAAEKSPTAAMYLGGALLGGAVGSAMSNKREGAMLGAGLGILFAALLDSATQDGRRS